MATYIYLNKGGFVPMLDENPLDVALKCCIDFKSAMRVVDSHSGTVMHRVDENDRQAFELWKQDSYDPKVHARISSLFNELKKTVYVPDASDEPRMRDSIQNPLISGNECI